MISLRNISIRNKLVLMQVLVSFIVLALFFTAFVISDKNGYKERKMKSVTTIAQVISSSSASALQFMDVEAAQRTLNELKVQDDIINAVILDRKGTVFSQYTREGNSSFKPPVKKDGAEYKDGYLVVYNGIIKENELLGTVCIRVDLIPLNEIIKEEIEIGVILLVVSVVLSVLISLYAQRFITTPLNYLVNVMQSIIGSGNYKSRAIVSGKDEISKLSLVFNEMLSQIEKRDNELEERVKERTSELEAANKELESFSYSVSHDMRAPLRAVSGFAKIVTKRYGDILDEDGKDSLQIINNETTRMGQLIDDLLAFSRLGKKEIQKFKVDMNALADSAMKEVLNIEQKSSPKVVIDKLPEAFCDGILIRQVLVNLFSNAVKYSSISPDAEIHVGAQVKPGKSIYYVKDNGVGFDMKYYHKLFGVFQRLHTQPEFKGTGIGLAIVQKIVSRHGGEVWAESEPGKGATFYFSLPK